MLSPEEKLARLEAFNRISEKAEQFLRDFTGKGAEVEAAEAIRARLRLNRTDDALRFAAGVQPWCWP